MCANVRKLCYLVPLLLFSSTPVFAAQVPKEASPAEALRARVVVYYGTLEKSEKTAALELVASESKNDFVRMNYDGLVDFRVLDVQLSDAGDTATVRVRRTDSFLGFPQLLKHETVDKWKRLDGQWYIVLPGSAGKKEFDTPFGKVTFAVPGENTQQATPPIVLPEPPTAVNPEQALRALQRAMLESSKQKAEDKEKKPEDKKSESQAVPKPSPQN
jgi:hypothetical protein